MLCVHDYYESALLFFRLFQPHYHLFHLRKYIAMFLNLTGSKQKTLLKNKEIFLRFNQNRLNLAFQIMPKRTALVFRAIPFLLHVNHQDFPGYVDNPATPSGIKNFQLPQEALNALQVLFPQAKRTLAKTKDIMPRHHFIRSLLLMGSIGSIAETKSSDFDYWVCIHNEHFRHTWMERFLKKLRLIELWAEKEYDVEVHFFPTDVKKARKDIYGEADKESAGSSQAKILKEELYRTIILVMGKIPIWWIMPPGVGDSDYEKLRKLIKTDKNIEEDHFVDLGNLFEISYKELSGAALWQINKAMDSPFKSVLKMGLLEGHIGARKQPELLCTTMKQKVFESEGKKLSLDPYMIMFSHVLRYYQSIKNEYVLDLLRKCFYIKIGVKANPELTKKKDLGFKERAVLHYIKQWEWKLKNIEDLNSYKEWDSDKVVRLGEEVHTFMKKTFQNITKLLKEKSPGTQLITKSDRTILGRKMLAFYTEKPNKLVNLQKAFEDGLLQDDLTFHTSSGKSENMNWRLYRDELRRVNPDQQDMGHKLLMQNSDLLFIITWMVFNKICDLKTRFHLTLNPTEVGLGDIQRLVKELFDFFPSFKVSNLANEDLLAKDRKKYIFVVVNFFSDRGKWDVESVTLAYLTTWGELFYESYDNPTRGIDTLCRYIKELDIKNKEKLPEHVRVFAPKGHQYKSLLQSVNKAIEKSIGVPSLPALSK